jgi:hypothetical protein
MGSPFTVHGSQFTVRHGHGQRGLGGSSVRLYFTKVLTNRRSSGQWKSFNCERRTSTP